MAAQPEHDSGVGFNPSMGTLAELRAALSTWGFPGDRQQFEAQLDAAHLDDLTTVCEITQAYRHRVLLRFDAQGLAAVARSTADVAAELQRRLVGVDRLVTHAVHSDVAGKS